MSALVYDYKSIAAHMKGELAPKKSWPGVSVVHDLTDEQVRMLREEWERGYGEFQALGPGMDRERT